jgi:type III secretion system low calcium response chaperone LcrH/SycD
MNNSEYTEEESLAIDAVQLLMQGATFKDLHGIDSEQMDTLYAFAHRFYEQGRLDEAARFFHFLCIYDFHNADYWCGNAAVHQMQGNHQKAIDLYAVSFALRIDDYRPMFYSGQCHLALGRPGKAKLCFEYAVESLDDDALRARAQAYLDVLSHIAADHSEDSTL